MSVTALWWSEDGRHLFMKNEDGSVTVLEDAEVISVAHGEVNKSVMEVEPITDYIDRVVSFR